MIRGLAAVFSVMILAALPNEADAARTCWVPNIRTLHNQTVNGTMTVKTGTRCTIILRTSSGPTHSASITARPSHGDVRISGNTVIYVPRNGYVGNDTFTYARVGLDARNNQSTRTVNIAVDVTP